MNRILFESGLYVACLLAGVGLTIQSKKTWKGQLMKPDHSQYASWSTAFTEGMDVSEGNDLCRAFLA